METVTFTYLGAKCEYNFETKNLHIISKHSFNSPVLEDSITISKEHNIKKEDIKTITFKHHHTQLPAHISSYFSDYLNLEYIELEKLDFKNVETIDGFICRCYKLKEITITCKNAPKLTSIHSLISNTEKTKSIKIKHINAPNLQKAEWLLWYINGNIEDITIEDITAPNIDFIDNLIYSSTVKNLDLTKIGDTSAQTIQTLIKYCTKLKTLEIKPLTNTKEIGSFIELSPLLETKIVSKINKVKKLDQYFLNLTQKNEILDLDKFEDISTLSSYLEESVSNKYIYPSIKIGKHKIKFSEYSIILENNIPIVDKTEEKIVKEMITQSKNETKKNIENFLETLENKKIFKNEEYEDQLTSKLAIIKNLK